jgi:hypothetical protein
LKALVERHLKSVDSALADLPLVAKVYASGDSLPNLLEKACLAEDAQDSHQALSQFARGFSQADDRFDFVLAGQGLDRADCKVMGSSDPASCLTLFLYS